MKHDEFLRKVDSLTEKYRDKDLSKTDINLFSQIYPLLLSEENAFNNIKTKQIQPESNE